VTSGVARTARATILGCEIDRLDVAGALRHCEEIIERGDFTQQVSINVAKLVALLDDPRLRETVNRCELINADGQGVVWASRLLGDPLPERVAGIDLMHRLLALAEKRGYRVFILGARPEVLERAVVRLREAHPHIVLVGHRHGYFGGEEIPAVCEEIRRARPQILFVAMSSPRKEYFLGEHGAELGVPFAMGVGGAIDVVAGVTKRAPIVLRHLGLEWLFRLLQEPRRLARRYVVTNSRFAVLLARALVTRALGSHPPAPSRPPGEASSPRPR
jgi:N-acetylglucosaminyldiphosphoundecaprenol N-acetyl-beta-D-mannosaminyltransferase